jgi:DNA-binding IclR family transcriptional regulator
MAATNEGPSVPPRRRRPSREPVRSYQAMRTVQALERLAFRPLSAPELGAAIRADQRTVRRLLRRLQAEGYVTQVGDHRRRYCLTHRLAALGRQAVAHDPLARAAAPHVAHLAAATGHVAALWIPCYTDVACILRADPDGRVPQPMLGDLEPAHATAPGKALLAHRDAWRDSLLARRLQRHTARTLTDPRELRAELDRIHVRGHATDHGAHHEDVHAIAAPVFLAEEAIAAIAVSLAAAEHATTDPQPLIAHTTSTAAALTAALHNHP